MKKKFFSALFIFSVLIINAQSLQSPEQFLGYSIGTKFTPAYKVVNYFNAVAQSAPSMVKLIKYGETYEGRDLLAAFISSPENISRLEDIRQNNLRLASITNGNSTTTDAPVIVWLSYNVHGNEPSSTEAAMLTLYDLITNESHKAWLKNTVVVIDPCQNPDGRDRYVNWYNTTVGSKPVTDQQSREHDEPWPYGRTNHYNFDLNRDWAWQTQKESQERITLYNKWLPQVHVDLHEQGYNEPYYFAPAAQPYHEVVTQWQRDFQVQIGRNHAKYFDANGWLYFTKEVFDLFYPSYGDTYPTYNGSIGMTYEQGGIGAGLAIETDDGDTLTLAQRAAHHFTTSISTVEISSLNKDKLISNFKKYFDDNIAGNGMDYKTYVITSKDANKIAAVQKLLDGIGIQYGSISQNFSGYNYFDKKDENFVDEGYNLAVSVLQPKGRMVKVLFEPQSKLVDSATYDITAWSIPYVYGVSGYQSKEKLSIQNLTLNNPVTDVSSDYGFIIPYTSFNASKLMSDLLQQHIRVKYSTSSISYNGKFYGRGTMLVLKGNNSAGWQKITNDVCKKYNVQPVAVSTGFMDAGGDFGSSSVKMIKAEHVAMLTGEEVSNTAAGEVWAYFDNEISYPLVQINTNHLRYADISKYDVIIMPDGFYSSLDDKSVSDKLKTFVENGGKLIAMEGGAAKLAGMEWSGLKLKENTSNNDSNLVKKYANSEREFLKQFIPGAIYKLNLDNTHPLAYGYPDYYYSLKQDSRLYEFTKDGWNVGSIGANAYTAGFAGSNVKSFLHDGMLIGEKQIGTGSIIVFADNPLFRLFWQNGKMLFYNAVFLAGE